MVIHDEETLQKALALVERSPVRYSDRFKYVTYSSSPNLEKALRSAIASGDVAIVVPVGEERTAEVYSYELSRVQARRRRQKMKDVKKWISDHPELKKAETEEEIVRLYRKSRK